MPQTGIDRAFIVLKRYEIEDKLVGDRNFLIIDNFQDKNVSIDTQKIGSKICLKRDRKYA